jgi:hypothetical protein
MVSRDLMIDLGRRLAVIIEPNPGKSEAELFEMFQEEVSADGDRILEEFLRGFIDRVLKHAGKAGVGPRAVH